MSDFYDRYEGRRSRRNLDREGRYGRSPEGPFYEPRGEGYGYGWRGEFGDPYGEGFGHGQGSYFGEPFDYSYVEENYEGEPYGPGHERQRSGYYRNRGDWRSPGPHTGIGPRNYQRSDERIFEVVCERLTRHGYVDARNIEVSVENGVVRLEGRVANRMQKRAAEDVADYVRGVHDVDNRLEIR